MLFLIKNQALQIGYERLFIHQLIVFSSDALTQWWGLQAPTTQQIVLFGDPKDRRLLRIPHFLALGIRLKGVLKSVDSHLERVLAGCSGYTATCEHSQELTPGLLKFKATSAFTAFVPSTTVQSTRAATPVVLGPPSTVPPRDCFLSPVDNGQGRHERELRSMLTYWLGTLPSP